MRRIWRKLPTQYANLIARVSAPKVVKYHNDQSEIRKSLSSINLPKFSPHFKGFEIWNSSKIIGHLFTLLFSLRSTNLLLYINAFNLQSLFYVPFCFVFIQQKSLKSSVSLMFWLEQISWAPSIPGRQGDKLGAEKRIKKRRMKSLKIFWCSSLSMFGRWIIKFLIWNLRW